MVQHHLLATHPVGRPILSGGTTGPEGSIFIVAILALVALIIRFTLPRSHYGRAAKVFGSLPVFRLGRDAASDWLTEVADAALANPTPEDYRQAFAMTRALADQPITLFDATIAALATRLGLPVWTYDHHFDRMRVAVCR